MPGFRWRSDNPNDHVCVATVGCGTCTPPAPRCAGQELVTSTAAGCVENTCSFAESRIACVTGCDAAEATCAGCANACGPVGTPQCAGGYSRVCGLDPQGCRAWQDEAICTSGLCGDEQSCAPCDTLCSEGAQECRDGSIRVCESGSGGCAAWVQVAVCDSGACADPESCAVAPVLGDLCSADDWCWVAPTPLGGNVAAVWSDGNVTWVASEGGALYQFDGTNWSAAYLGDQEEVLALWGSAADDVWAVGRNGLLLHFDGAAWRYGPRFLSDHLVSVWGSAANDVYASGGHNVLHFDGNAWAVLDIYIGGFIAGHGNDDLCVVASYGGTMRCWDGATWSYEQAWDAAVYGVKAAFATNDGSYYAVDSWNYLARREADGYWREVPNHHPERGYLAVTPDGTAWRSTQSFSVERQVGDVWQAEVTAPCALSVLTTDPSGGLWLGGGCGYLARKSAADWQQLSGFDQRFKDLYLLAADPTAGVFAAGGQTARLQGGTWTFWDHDFIIQALAFVGPDLWALAPVLDQQYQLMRWAGDHWDVRWQGALVFDFTGTDIFGTDANNIYIAGSPLQHFNGVTVTPVTAAGYATAVGGSSANVVWTVGQARSIWRFDGGTWQRMYAAGPAGSGFEEILALGPDDVWFGGSVGSFYHWNGTHFMGFPSPGNLFAHSLTRGASGGAWIAASYSGFNDDVLEWDGMSWRTHRTQIGREARDFAQTAAGTWLLGAGRMKFRATPATPCAGETEAMLCSRDGLACGDWLADGSCGRVRRIHCGTCASGVCGGTGAQAGQCVAPIAQALDCGADDAAALAASGSIQRTAYFVVGLCGSSLAMMGNTNTSLIEYDVATQSTRRTVSFPAAIRQVVLDRYSASLFVLAGKLYRVSLATWTATPANLVYDAQHVASGEPGELFVQVFRPLPENASVGHEILQVVSTSSLEVLHTIDRQYQSGAMQYDAEHRELFSYGWYNLNQMAYDPRQGRLLRLEAIDRIGLQGAFSGVLAGAARKYIAVSGSDLLVLDTRYLVDSANRLLPDPYDPSLRSLPAIDPDRQRMVVQHEHVAEWLDLETFSVVASAALPACDYVTTFQPFFSASGSVLYAPSRCGSQDVLRWVKP